MNSAIWWHEQADLLTDRLIETQNYNERIPVPAGATIASSDFYRLAEKALASEPISKGNYEDGYHFISLKDTATVRESANFYDETTNEVRASGSFDYYTFASVVVFNGRIVLAYYNSAYSAYHLSFDENGSIRKKLVDHDNNPETDDINLSVIENYHTASPTLYTTKNQLGNSYGMAAVSGGFEYFNRLNQQVTIWF